MKIKITILLLVFLISANIYSQLSSYNFQSVFSTFTHVTGGTVLGNTANDEEVFNNNTTGEAPPQTDIGFSIGFNFFYNGAFYDKFAVSTNGWIMLGNGSFTIGKTSKPLSYSAAAGFANIISVLGRDLQGQTGSELSYKLTGIAPYRMLTVQWLNYRRYNISSGESLNFQINLNETDNSISFVYGTMTTTNTSPSTSNNPTQVGLRGAVNSDYKNRRTTSDWSASTAGTINTHTMRHTTTVQPASGLEYKWTLANMTYASSTTLDGGNTSYKKNSVNNTILKVEVETIGGSNPLSATSFTFNTNGTEDADDISNARVWFTGASPEFSTAHQFGTTVANPNGSFTVTGSKVLVSGTNYFWLTYDVKGSAVTGHKVDGECNSITIVNAKIPTVNAPAGFGTITNAPLQGTYTIGLQLFNLAAGKDLHFRKSSRLVTREFIVETNNTFTKRVQKDDVEIAGDFKKEERQVSEDTYVLMDGNTPYTGPVCRELTTEFKNRNASFINLTEVLGVYASITDAFNDISSNGISGPVNFLLVDEVYSSETFPILLKELNGSSAINTFTLKPAPGVTPEIIMSSGTSVIKVFDSQFITIDGSNTAGGTSRDLSVISNDFIYSFGIWIGSSSNKTITDITVKNCIVRTGESFIGSIPILLADGSNSSSPGYMTNVTVSNNLLQKGRYGLFINGGTNIQNISNVNISGNILNSSGADAIGNLGIYTQGVTSGMIVDNEIANLNSSVDEMDKGIWLANGSHDMIVERNKIYNIGYTGNNGYGGHGIFISANHANACDTIRNNVIYNIFGDGWNYLDAIYYLDNPCGIALYSSTPQSGISLLNNSINLYGNTLMKTGAASFGVFASSNTSADILNNVISNNLGIGDASAYGSCGVFAQNSHNQFINIDYNNYYINPTGNGVKAIGKISNVKTSTGIDNWRSVTFQDKSSLSFDPGFTSNTDLTPNINNSSSWSLNGRGKQQLSVKNDFNGNLRSITVPAGSPDIGAYEFTPVSIPPIISGSGSMANGNTTYFIFGGDTAAAITWHGSTLPASVNLKFFSGTNPPSAFEGNYGNCYWEFETSGGSGYTFDLTLNWDPARIGSIGDVSRISIANYTSNVWEHYDASVDAVKRTTTKNGLSQLTTFTIDDMSSPLPVNLLYFTSNTTGRNVKLKWATSWELNNRGFEVERKSHAQSNWQLIGFVDGRGNSNTEAVYEFNDPLLCTGSYNYRLKQIDYSGNAEYFILSLVVVIGKPLDFVLGQNYPNPSNPKARIDYELPFDTELLISVYDIGGREVKKLFDGFSIAGYYAVEFDGTDLASGIYFYRIQTPNYSKTLKLILIK